MPYKPTVLVNAQILVGTSSADISDHVTKAVLTERITNAEDSRMGSRFTSRYQTVADWSLSVDVINDLESTGAGLDATLSILVCSTSPFPVKIRAVNAARSSDNPEWSGNMVLGEFTSVNGAWGEIMRATLPFMGAGALTRSVTTS